MIIVTYDNKKIKFWLKSLKKHVKYISDDYEKMSVKLDGR